MTKQWRQPASRGLPGDLCPAPCGGVSPPRIVPSRWRGTARQWPALDRRPAVETGQCCPPTRATRTGKSPGPTASEEAGSARIARHAAVSLRATPSATAAAGAAGPPARRGKALARKAALRHRPPPGCSGPGLASVSGAAALPAPQSSPCRKAASAASEVPPPPRAAAEVPAATAERRGRDWATASAQPAMLLQLAVAPPRWHRARRRAGVSRSSLRRPRGPRGTPLGRRSFCPACCHHRHQPTALAWLGWCCIPGTKAPPSPWTALAARAHLCRQPALAPNML